jgi:WD40 repeat protein
LLPPGSAEFREAELILRGADDYSPIWHGPVATFYDGTTSESARVVEFSPDGRLLASGSGATNIGLWDVATGVQKAVLRGHSNDVVFVAFSPDGAVLALGCNDGTVELWEVATHQKRKEWKGHSRMVFSLAFSSDGRFLASGSVDTTIKLWGMPGGEHTEIRGHTSRVGSVQFSPDGGILASEDETGLVRLWELPQGTPKATLRPTLSDIGGRLFFSPDGSLLAAGGLMIRLWELTSGHIEAELTGHTAMVREVALDRDGSEKVLQRR